MIGISYIFRNLIGDESMTLKFYICEHCKNIVTLVKSSGAPLSCCGENMKELLAGTTDAAIEKHVPAFEAKDGKVFVQVGETEHPMLPAHFIEWICLKSDKGIQIKHLSPEDKPKAEFSLLDGEQVEEVYAYCYLHGLWKK